MKTFYYICTPMPVPVLQAYPILPHYIYFIVSLLTVLIEKQSLLIVQGMS